MVLFAGGGWLIPSVPTESSGICINTVTIYEKEQAWRVEAHKPTEPGTLETVFNSHGPLPEALLPSALR